MVVVVKEEKLVYDIKLSSVVPARVTGENKFHELTVMDLAMKLHYLKGLYFFKNYNNNKDHNSSLVSCIYELKHDMFEWLVPYFIACGRVRTASPETGGRPVIKLNDAGVRIVEARSSKTVDEWLAMDGFLSLQDQLVYGDHLGPDLGFTPLVFIQVTWFKCGGISVGLSWAHVLGDVFSASTFMNMLGYYLQDQQQQGQILSYPDSPKPKCPLSRHTFDGPRSLKRVDPVGNHWVVATNCNMVTHSFHLTTTQLAQFHSRAYGSKNERMIDKHFEIISAIMWKSIAKVRKYLEPKVVTICKPKSIDREQIIPYNGQEVGTIEVNVSVSKINLLELVSLIDKNMIDETNEIEELVKEESGKVDFVVYGANLTFVNMEEANIYGFKLQGQFPTFASYTINGIGEEGAILVLPGAKDGKENVGKLIVVVLPEHELDVLKNELREEWCIM